MMMRSPSSSLSSVPTSSSSITPTRKKASWHLSHISSNFWLLQHKSQSRLFTFSFNSFLTSNFSNLSHHLIYPSLSLLLTHSLTNFLSLFRLFFLPNQHVLRKRKIELACNNLWDLFFLLFPRYFKAKKNKKLFQISFGVCTESHQPPPPFLTSWFFLIHPHRCHHDNWDEIFNLISSTILSKSVGYHNKSLYNCTYFLVYFLDFFSWICLFFWNIECFCAIILHRNSSTTCFTEKSGF